MTMAKPIERELAGIRKDVKCHALEDFELSDRAKAALKKARETPDAEYVEL